MKFFKRKKKPEAPAPAEEAVVPAAEDSATGSGNAPGTDPVRPEPAVPEDAAAAPGVQAPLQSQAAPEPELQPAAEQQPAPEPGSTSPPGPETQPAPGPGPTSPPGPETQPAVAGQQPGPGAATPLAVPETPAPAPEKVEEPASEPSPQAAPAATPADSDKPGFFSRLRRGLGKTSDNLVQGLGNLFLGRKEIDADLLEELESRLLMADVGVEATMEIIDRLTQRVSRRELTNPQALQGALKEELLALLKPCEQPLSVSGHKPYVILMVGVNGVGKTTTIGKLAKRFQTEGRSVMLAAGDTFRAAAVEQLQVWGERNQVPVIAQHTGADSASVVFDALQAAQARQIDVLIADTAGRLHNKDNLMEELKKVVRVMGKLDDSAPHEVMLVLDAGTGQNALAQADHFRQWVGVSGVSLTKLDGTAKGGVIFAIARKLGLPIRFIGIGESAEDLRPFEADPFIEALFAGDDAVA
ncbi:signal recognition particle-docking protein FtsY [Seongchinamella sediminis]|uniref:Signal recognition particle receptor FtsY n=1 Tax=Seongchinamella sediminis TaxID=2283635 RepID=A0A3L7DTI6_9GAMM|nr:signal recognition particle-docking protein FtsY [Seongchinamella sediminis]